MSDEINGLILDLDDTLVDTRGAMIAAGRRGAATVWSDVDDDRHTSFAELFFADPGDFYSRYANGELTFDQMRRGRVAHTSNELGLPEPGERFSDFERAYRAEFGASQRAFDDVTELLDAAAARKIPVVLLTNSSADHAEMKLAAVGLAERFVGVVTVDTFGFGKPDRRIFDHAAELVGVRRSTILSVGDHLERDVLAALDAGMQGAWLVRDHHLVTEEERASAAARGVRTVAGLAQISALLGRPAR